MVGNGVTNYKYDTTPAYIEIAFWHGLYDIDMYEDFHENNCHEELSFLEFKDVKDIKEACLDLFIEL